MIDVKNSLIVRSAINVPLKQIINHKVASKIMTFDLDAALSWKLRNMLTLAVESSLDFKNYVICGNLTASILRFDPTTGGVNRSINDFVLVNNEICHTLASSIYVEFSPSETFKDFFAITLVGKEEGGILGFISAEKEIVALDALKKMLQKNVPIKSKSKKRSE